MAETKASAKKKQVVTAPLVVVADEGGRQVYLYAGASLDGIAQSEIDRLVDMKMVGDAEGVVPGVAVDYNPA